MNETICLWTSGHTCMSTQSVYMAAPCSWDAWQYVAINVLVLQTVLIYLRSSGFIFTTGVKTEKSPPLTPQSISRPQKCLHDLRKTTLFFFVFVKDGNGRSISVSVNMISVRKRARRLIKAYFYGCGPKNARIGIRERARQTSRAL